METHYPGAEIVELDFESRDQWVNWLDRPSADHVLIQIANVVAHTQAHGVWEPLTKRYFAPDKIEWDGRSFRESGFAGGIGSRNRAVLYALHSCVPNIDFTTKIYGSEAITSMSLLLRGNFPRFIGSEYTDDPIVSRDLFPIPTEDLTSLSFQENVFDAVVTTEVLEHVPSLDAALSEVARVLRPGGWHVGTCPFAFMDESSIVKARVENGQIVHIADEPEYHGDPMGTGGSLVFEIPAWDILSRARSAGFSYAAWKYVISKTFGIASEHTGGVFVLCLRK